jgi:hypothetical protein
VRTHRSWDKDAPLSRPVQRTGIIMSYALLGGLHHPFGQKIRTIEKTVSCPFPA